MIVLFVFARVDLTSRCRFDRLTTFVTYGPEFIEGQLTPKAFAHHGGQAEQAGLTGYGFTFRAGLSYHWFQFSRGQGRS